MLLRLSPLIPFNALNYASGVLSVSFWDYTVGCVGMIPGCAAFVYLGAGLEDMAGGGGGGGDGEGAGAEGGKSNVVDIVVWVVGALFAFLAVALVSKAAKKELAKVIEAEDEGQKKRLSAVKRRLSMVNLSPDELDIVADPDASAEAEPDAEIETGTETRSQAELPIPVHIDTSEREGEGGDGDVGSQSLISAGATLSTQV